MLRKTARLIKRTLFCLCLILIGYTLHVQFVSLTSWEQPDENVEPKQILQHEAEIKTEPLSNDFTFNTNDMLDEFGQPYTIIIWSNGKGDPGYRANPQECLGNIGCTITFDREKVGSAHAFVFKADETRKFTLPHKRKPFQLYTWWSSESPRHSAALKELDDVFNLTFHYRTDADVYAPYGSINLILRDLKAAGETELEPLLKRKKISGKMAAWAVSNCYWRRLLYAKQLMKAGLDVETYGKCFNGRELGEGRFSETFYERLSEFKFYLAFENSIGCKDYFTEKFWYNGLRAGAVPIVWGPRKEDILKVAPTHSFIHTDDFSSPKELVEYLNYLASNETAYAEYHQWRTWINHPERIEERLRLENREYDLRSFCKLCSIVQADGRRRKRGLEPRTRVVPSLREAWLGAENKCNG